METHFSLRNLHSELLVRPESIKIQLKSAFHACRLVSCLISCFFLLALLLCPPLLEVLRYFLPILFSTGLCFMAVYMFVSSENKHFDGWEDDCGGQVCIDIDTVQVVACLNSAWAEEKEEEGGGDLCFWAGMGSDGICEEEKSLAAENLAEGLWNCYLGRYSKWHYNS